ITDHFTYTITDPSGLTSTATVDVVVRSSINQPPIAAADQATLNEDGVLAAVVNLLGTATDPDGLPGDPPPKASISPADYAAGIRYLQMQSQRGATVRVTEDGSFTYDAFAVAAIQALNVGQTLQDTFTYEIVDILGAHATGTVTLTVTGVNDAPTARD